MGGKGGGGWGDLGGWEEERRGRIYVRMDDREFVAAHCGLWRVIWERRAGRS